MNELSPTLKNSIEDLYKTFSRYPYKESEFCSCCVSKKENKNLGSKPLREFSGEELSRYARKAITTWGNAENFKHFLPRIFELVARNELDLDFEIAFGKVEDANWQDWSEKERAAVENFFNELMRFAVKLGGEDIYLSSDFFTAIAYVVSDVKPYLDLWLESPTLDQVFNLHYFIVENEYSSASAFLAGKPKPRRQTLDWLKSRTTADRLEKLFFENAKFQNTNELAEIIDALTVIKHTN